MASQVGNFNMYRQDEEWRPVLGFEGFYEVSNYGRVMRTGRATGATPGRILRPSREHEKYLLVHLQKDDERPVSVRVHRLVFAAFNGAIRKGGEINHIDGDKTNNCLANLEVVDHLENIRHAITTGLFNQWGERNRRAKLDEATVRSIKALHVRGKIGYDKLARMFDINRGTVRDILAGKTWACVPSTVLARPQVIHRVAEALWLQVAPAKKTPPSPIRSKLYRRFVGKQPCAVCGAQTAEASHTGEHGLSVKSSDYFCIPLCSDHHRTGVLAYHKIGREGFEQAHGICIDDLVSALQLAYQARRNR